MTATGELRAMLDERGVEWGIADYSKHKRMTVWRVDGMEWKYFEDDKTGWTVLDSRRDYLTPAQAIAATLGAGTCHNECDQRDFLCSECGARMYTETDDTYTMIDSLGNIVEQPSFCPNCGTRVVEVDE